MQTQTQSQRCNVPREQQRVKHIYHKTNYFSIQGSIVGTSKEYDVDVTEISRQGDDIGRVQGFVDSVQSYMLLSRLT